MKILQHETINHCNTHDQAHVTQIMIIYNQNQLKYALLVNMYLSVHKTRMQELAYWITFIFFNQQLPVPLICDIISHYAISHYAFGYVWT